MIARGPSPPRAARLSNITLCPCGCWKNFLCCPNHARMVNRFPPRACAPSVRYRASVPAVAQRGCWDLCETNEDLVAEADHLDPLPIFEIENPSSNRCRTAPSPHLSSSSTFWEESRVVPAGEMRYNCLWLSALMGSQLQYPSCCSDAPSIRMRRVPALKSNASSRTRTIAVYGVPKKNASSELRVRLVELATLGTPGRPWAQRYLRPLFNERSLRT
jgi:hypothetical protein